MEHYEIIVVSLLAATTIWVVVSAVAIPFAFWLIREEQPALVPGTASKPLTRIRVEEAATPEPLPSGRTPVGAH